MPNSSLALLGADDFLLWQVWSCLPLCFHFHVSRTMVDGNVTFLYLLFLLWHGIFFLFSIFLILWLGRSVRGHDHS